MTSLSSPLETVASDDKRVNSLVLPRFGLGTHCVKPEAATQCVADAIQVGYRLVDTASCYKNEAQVGSALQLAWQGKIPGCGPLQRHEVFVTTKLNPQDQTSYDRVIEAFHVSLVNLQLTYIDCYMMHWPATSGLRPSDPLNIPFRQDCWHAMEDLKKQGLVRFLGVSNFLPHHIETLPSYPDINQIELHPLCRQQECVEYCRKRGIMVQAYSPIGRADPLLFKNAALMKFLKEEVNSNRKNSCTEADACLLAGFAQEYDSIIARSVNMEHLQKNFETFQYWETASVVNPVVKSKYQQLSDSIYNESARGGTNSQPPNDHHFCWFSDVVAS